MAGARRDRSCGVGAAGRDTGGGTNASRGVARHRPAKLVLWAGSFEPAGTQRFLLEFLTRLDRDRFEPIVFSTLARGELLPAVRALGVPVHEFGTGTGVFASRTLRDLSRASSFLRRERVDVLSCMLGLTTLVGPFVGRAAGVPVVVNNQRNLSYWFNGGVKESIYAFASRRLVDAVIVNSEAASDELATRFRVPERKIENVGVGTDLEKIARAVPDRELSDSLGLEGRRVIGIVAKLSSVKGHRFFLEAAAIVSAAVPDMAFVVVGDGPERGRLESAASALGLTGKVHFLGVREDVPSILKLMDVLVLSSLSEGSPNVVIEAMAAGVPVVATRVGGVPELVQDGVTGLLVESADALGLAHAVRELLDDPGRARAMGDRAANLAAERYDINAVVDRMQNIFTDLLAGRSRRDEDRGRRDEDRGRRDEDRGRRDKDRGRPGRARGAGAQEGSGAGGGA